MEHLFDFDGKPLRAAEKAELNVGELEKKEGTLSEEDAKDLAKWLKEKLADRVGEVRVSQRLVDSPAVVVEADKHLTSSMRRILKAAKRGQEDTPDLSKQDLEINPRHAIMMRLQTMRKENADLAVKVAEQVLDNARVAAGLLEDPRTMLKRLNELLEQVLVAPAK